MKFFVTYERLPSGSLPTYKYLDWEKHWVSFSYLEDAEGFKTSLLNDKYPDRYRNICISKVV